MSWGFERGRLYNRRQDIHGPFGGQQQGGIITPAQHSLVIVITGEEGAQHGYSDRQRDDGVFEYFGEGQVGDMVMQRGNRRILEHSADGKSLLLFRKSSQGVRFIDEMVCESHHHEPAPDRNGEMRQAIVFELRPLGAVDEETGNAPVSTDTPLDQLRQRAFAAAQNSAAASTSTTPRTVYQRSRDVRDYVLARAQGHCEGCNEEAPFLRADGSPYLEPHHIRRVSDGGPDDPRFVIALCPNCHRRVHAGQDGEAYNQTFLKTILNLEAGAQVRARKSMP